MRRYDFVLLIDFVLLMVITAFSWLCLILAFTLPERTVIIDEVEKTPLTEQVKENGKRNQSYTHIGFSDIVFADAAGNYMGNKYTISSAYDPVHFLDMASSYRACWRYTW